MVRLWEVPGHRLVREVGGVPPWALTVVSMSSVQLGSALSLGLISTVGAAGTAWLRLSIGGLIFLAITRPPQRGVHRRDLVPLAGLGVMTGVMTVAFLAAIQRLPLGTAVAIEFLGALTVAALNSHRARALAWPGVALVGVLLLTEPWTGDIDLVGVAFAGVGAVGWGSNIYLTQRVGDRFTGVRGLSITVPIAAATAAVVGIPQAAGHLTPTTMAAAAGLALLLPVLPFALNMLALRRMTRRAFGTLIAVEPAIGALVGLLVLNQTPTGPQIIGIACVVVAGAAVQRNGHRQQAPHPPTTPAHPAAPTTLDSRPDASR